ncbi:hypothetical protein EDF75_3567 [Raoultella sp. BIGb0149]|nr:hypothetical protein EDF75_3567 [Raoultella sp. BIGb0149]
MGSGIEGIFRKNGGLLNASPGLLETGASQSTGNEMNGNAKGLV